MTRKERARLNGLIRGVKIMAFGAVMLVLGIIGLLVFLLVMFSWILFKFTDFHLMATAVKGLFGLNGNGFTGVDVTLAFRNNVFFLIFCAVASTPIGVSLRNMLKNLSLRGCGLFWLNGVVEIAIPVVLLLLSASALAGDSYNPFLYFRF